MMLTRFTGGKKAKNQPWDSKREKVFFPQGIAEFPKRYVSGIRMPLPLPFGLISLSEASVSRT
jgi:hypothetical protein